MSVGSLLNSAVNATTTAAGAASAIGTDVGQMTDSTTAASGVSQLQNLQNQAMQQQLQLQGMSIQNGMEEQAIATFGQMASKFSGAQIS
jgi:hypothetical protein